MKKTIALLLVTVMCLTLAVGCGNETAGTQSSNGGGNQATEMKKGPLTAVISKEPVALVPWGSNDTGTSPIISQMYEPLLTINQNNEFIPCLAESYEQIDETHYRFKIRKDVKFHNGNALDANDVIFTFEQITSSDTTSETFAYVDMANTKAEDDYTVVIALTQPYPTFIKTCSLSISAIVDKETFESVGYDGYNAKPVGTGPFMFKEWATGDYLKFDANPNWWNGEIAITELTLRYIAEGTTRAVEVESGNALAGQIVVTDAATIDANPDIDFLMQPIWNTSFLGFNCAIEPFNKLEVRQAISLALDTPSIVKAAYGEYGMLAKSFISPSMWGYYDAGSVYSGYDLEEAKELLAAAGYPDGFSCELICYNMANVAEIIQNQLAAIGIKVKLNTTDFSNWLSAVTEGKQQLWLGGWTVDSGDISEAYTFFNSKATNFYNRCFYKNEKVDELLSKIDSESNEEVRMGYAKELQILLADECVTIGLNVGHSYWAVSKKITGFHVLPTQTPVFSSVRFK